MVTSHSVIFLFKQCLHQVKASVAPEASGFFGEEEALLKLEGNCHSCTLEAKRIAKKFEDGFVEWHKQRRFLESGGTEEDWALRQSYYQRLASGGLLSSEEAKQLKAWEALDVQLRELELKLLSVKQKTRPAWESIGK